MLDTNLLFSNAQALAADGFSTNALNIKKTPGDGVDVEVALTALAGFTALVVTCYERAADSGWAITDPQAGQSHPPITAVGRYFFRIKSKLAFVKLNYDFTGAGTATITAGIVSGVQRDTNA